MKIINVLYVLLLSVGMTHAFIDFGSIKSAVKIDRGASFAVRSRQGMNFKQGTFVEENGNVSTPSAYVIGNSIYFDNSFLQYHGAENLFTGAYNSVVAGQAFSLTATNVRLKHDVILAGPVALSGIFNGNGHNIFLDDDLTIPAGATLHITGSSMVIDGRGHKLFVDDWAQIFVDTDVTLTLRNVTVGNGRRSLTYPPIRLAAYGTSLALDNVTIAAVGDFQFPQGQLFVHNDVKFTGTSAFIYTSPIPSWIASNSRLYFDIGTTFSIAPATFTDAPFTLKNTYTDCNFIKMADKSSQLCLNNCSLMGTSTGLRLCKGSIYFNDHDILKSYTNNELISYGNSAIYTFAGQRIWSIAISPDCRYIAVGRHALLPNFRIYRISTDGLQRVGAETGAGISIESVDWSPDGKFIVVGDTSGSTTLTVFKFDGINTPQIIGTSVNTNLAIVSNKWSPDGKYIAAGSYGAKKLYIYSFDGFTTPQLITSSETLAGNIFTVDWSPDGKYVAVGTDTGGHFYIFKFNGTTLTQISYINTASSTNIRSVKWSHDERFVAVGFETSSSNNLRVYKFNESYNATLIANASTGGAIRSTPWSPDDRYIAAASTNGFLSVYEFNRMNTLSLVGTPVDPEGTDNDLFSADWSFDGNVIAIGIFDATATTTNLIAFRTRYGNVTTPQALSKSIVFGDSAKGTEYDVDVQILSDAQVTVQGKIFDDSVLN
jgi:WD40 repeat protein